MIIRIMVVHSVSRNWLKSSRLSTGMGNGTIMEVICWRQAAGCCQGCQWHSIASRVRLCCHRQNGQSDHQDCRKVKNILLRNTNPEDVPCRNVFGIFYINLKSATMRIILWTGGRSQRHTPRPLSAALWTTGNWGTMYSACLPCWSHRSCPCLMCRKCYPGSVPLWLWE